MDKGSLEQRLKLWASSTRYADAPWALHSNNRDTIPPWIMTMMEELSFAAIREALFEHVDVSIKRGEHPNIFATGTLAQAQSWPRLAAGDSGWTGPDAAAVRVALDGTFDEGRGVQIRWAERIFPSISSAIERLESAANRRLKANVFMSGPGANVFNFPHQDMGPNVFVGIARPKRVTMAPGGYLQYPFTERILTDDEFMACRPMATILSPGSVMSSFWGNPHHFITVPSGAADGSRVSRDMSAIHVSISPERPTWYPSRVRTLEEVIRIATEIGSTLPEKLAYVQRYRSGERPHDRRHSYALFDAFREVEELINTDPAFSRAAQVWEAERETPWGRELWAECFVGDGPDYPYRGTEKVPSAHELARENTAPDQLLVR